MTCVHVLFVQEGNVLFTLIGKKCEELNAEFIKTSKTPSKFKIVARFREGDQCVLVALYVYSTTYNTEEFSLLYIQHRSGEYPYYRKIRQCLKKTVLYTYNETEKESKLCVIM